ncbi:MAG: hypothetical protein ACREOM_02670 [Candidatus Dormibacteraceae bacterium]
MPRRLAGLGTPLVIVLAVVALLIAADAGIVAVRLASTHAGSSSPGVARTGPGQGPHPCNHGFYVSQAAHSKKGGSYVSGIAKSKLGKQGGCTAPLPAGAPSAPSDSPDGN